MLLSELRKEIYALVFFDDVPNLYLRYIGPEEEAPPSMDMCRHMAGEMPPSAFGRVSTPFANRVGSLSQACKQVRSEVLSELLHHYPPVVQLQDIQHFAGSVFMEFMSSRTPLTIDTNFTEKRTDRMDVLPLLRWTLECDAEKQRSQSNASHQDRQQEDQDPRDIVPGPSTDKGKAKQLSKDESRIGRMQLEFRALPPLGVFACFCFSQTHDSRHSALVKCSHDTTIDGCSRKYARVFNLNPKIRKSAAGLRPGALGCIVAKELQQLVTWTKGDTDFARSIQDGTIARILVEWPKGFGEPFQSYPSAEDPEDSEYSGDDCDSPDKQRNVRVTIVPRDTKTDTPMTLNSLGIRTRCFDMDQGRLVEFRCGLPKSHLWRLLFLRRPQSPGRSRPPRSKPDQDPIDRNHSETSGASGTLAVRLKGTDKYVAVRQHGHYWLQRLPEGYRFVETTHDDHNGVTWATENDMEDLGSSRAHRRREAQHCVEIQPPLRVDSNIQALLQSRTYCSDDDNDT